jgi:hypothetical protein
MLPRRLTHPWIMCSWSHIVVTHVLFPFPLRAPVGSMDLFHVSDLVHGSLYNIYGYLSCTAV